MICEVKLVHIKESILNEAGKIDPNKIDLVGRMGGNWYCRASQDAIFKVEKPLTKLGIGIDNIPSDIRNSVILSGNDLGILGNVETIPSMYEVEQFCTANKLNDHNSKALHQRAKELLNQGNTLDAWKTLLIDKLDRV